MSEDPSEIRFNEKPGNIFALNNWPMYVVIGGICLLLGGLLIETEIKHEKAVPVDKPRETVRFSEKDDSDRWFDDDKYKNVKVGMVKTAPKPMTPREVEMEEISDKEMDYRQEVVNEKYDLRMAVLKLKNKAAYDKEVMEYQAMRAPLTMNTKEQSSGDSSGAQSSGGGILDQIQKFSPAGPQKESSPLTGVSSNVPAAPSDLDINKQDQKNSYLKSGVSDSDYLPYHKVKPVSPYELKAGTYLPAALITGINSDLPAPVTAQITEDVYDTVTGNYLLVPQGAKLIGEYNSRLSSGQTRVQIVWTRMIFPDGSSIDLEKMAGVDVSGQGGFSDLVNNHFWRIYSNAFLLSLVGAGYDILNNQQQQNSSGQLNAQQTVAANVGQKLSDVTSKSLEKNMDIQPTIIIRPGYKFQVAVVKDIVLDDLNGDTSDDPPTPRENAATT